MQLPKLSAIATKLVWLDETDSTNVKLVEALQSEPGSRWPHGSVLLTDNQTAGRGRLARTWSTPPHTAVAVSVVLRPLSLLAPELYGWVPLIAGAAMVEAVRECAKRYDVASLASTHLKWPNDVLVSYEDAEAKLCGILAELVPGVGIVVGAGLNTALTQADLPVPTATSLEIAGGGGISVDELLSLYLAQLLHLYDALADPQGPELVRSRVTGLLGTLGRDVSIERPGTAKVTGRAIELASGGELVVQEVDGPLVLSAGDITHLRY